MTTLKDGSTVEDPRLGRIREFDDKSCQFPVRELLPPSAQPTNQMWTLPRGAPVLDQGQEGSCFPAGTLIRMADGSHKPIQAVQLLDQVVTAEGRLGTVTQHMVRKSDRGTVAVEISGHLTLRCTPEHPVLTRRGYVPASELTVEDKVAIPRFHAASDVPLVPTDLVDLAGWRGAMSGQVNTGGVATTVSPLPAILPRTPDLGRLLGLYAAEGCVSANRVVWSYGGHEADTLVADTIALVKSVFGAVARVQRRPNGSINVVLYGKHWRLLFAALIPGTARHGDKRLSSHVTHGPEQFLRGILTGWLEGDGHARRTERSGVTVSRQLALDMHAIAHALGTRPCVRASRPSINRAAATRQMRYDCSFGTGGGSNRSAESDEVGMWRTVKAVRTDPDAREWVYNLEVAGDHSYVADGVGVHNCVGFGVTNELRFHPFPVAGLDASWAKQRVYWEAQKIDPWPGGSYPGATPFYEGTSVLSGVKTGVKIGHYTEYRWAFGEPDLALGLSLGPAIIGVNWHANMSRPNSRGYLRPTGDIQGGHCCLLIGITINRVSSYYTLYNSWGPSWGKNGTAKISRSDMAKLLAAGGEACIITGRATPPSVRVNSILR